VPGIVETLSAQDGLIRTSQLAYLTADRAELRRWTRRLRRLTHGVYGDPHDDDPLLLHRAVVMCLPGVVFRARTALLLHGVPHVDPPERLQVFVGRDCDASDRPELEVRRTDLVTLSRTDVGALPVVSPARAAVDLVRELSSRQDGLAVLDGVMRLGATRDDLRAELVPGSRRVRRARELVELADGRAESPPESWVRMILHDAGVPAPVIQHEVRVDGRVLARLDMAWPEIKLYLEYDGREAHSTDEAFLRDRRRQNDLLALGWVCLRFTAEDLRSPYLIARRVTAELNRLTNAA
jgi:hypothetical protein